MEERHTATPWHLGGHQNRIIYANDGFAVADATVFHGRHEGLASANAEFIVRACNAHDDLVEALQESLKWIFGQADKDEDQEQWDIVKEIRAALHKAGVQP